MSEQPEQSGYRPIGSRSLAHNSYISFVGQVAPIPAAIIAIPLLIGALGTERFGLLALAWVVMSYFSLFDFGLGRATTKFVAEHHARSQHDALPALVWTSTLFHSFLGLVGGGILALLTPWLVGEILNIRAALVDEARTSFYLLAVSVPLIVANAALRGVLEAFQKFGLLTAIKVPASIINYLGPLPVLYFVDSLAAVIGFLVLSRGVVLLSHLLSCFWVMPDLLAGVRFDSSLIKPLLRLGGWLTVFGAIGPSVASIDRFMIGAFVSLSAVTLYTTPYEVITKLTMFSASMLAVLFPAFSAMAVDRIQEIRPLYLRALKYLLVLVAPIIGLVLALAFEFLSLWVGPEVAQGSAPVARWLAIGILIHVLAHVSFTVLQSIGRADLTAKLQLAQLPFYVIAVWYLMGLLGIVGVAVAWTLRVTVDAIILFVLADRALPKLSVNGKAFCSWYDLSIFVAFLSLCLISNGIFVGTIGVKVAVILFSLGLFLLWEWYLFLDSEDRKTFVGGAKSLLILVNPRSRRRA